MASSEFEKSKSLIGSYGQPESTPARKDNSLRRAEERMDILTQKLEELAKLMTMKTERLMVKVRLMEERQNEFIMDTQKKLTGMVTRSAELPRVEMRMHEVIEKHNQVVRAFENKINQIKRLVDQQEVQLFKAMGELEESRKEIARLKRLT
ncbi:MAG: hypothetical protein AB7F59_00350 [Bdellovibrionales bacterium]